MEREQLIMVVTCVIVLFGGVLLFKKSHGQIGENSLQVAGMVFIMPVVMVLSGMGCIDSDTVSVILGAVVGYFFRIAKD